MSKIFHYRRVGMYYLDVKKISRAQMQYTPYPNTSISYAIFKDKVDELRKTFPKDHYVFHSRKMGHDKTYKLCGRPLIAVGIKEPVYSNYLSHEWQVYCGELLSPEYRDSISELIKIDLTRCFLGVDLWRFNPGDECFISPHADVPWKTVTHVCYFVKEWHNEWGGLLGIHDCQDENDCKKLITPSMEISAILVRTDDSFHSITPVKKEAKECRKVLDIVFYNQLPPPPKKGRIDGISVSPEEFIDL